MNVHKPSARRVRPARVRAAEHRARRGKRTNPLDLDLVEVMLDLDPGMLVWSNPKRW